MKSRTKKILFILLFAIGILVLGQKNVSAYAQHYISQTCDIDNVVWNGTVIFVRPSEVLKQLKCTYSGTTYTVIYKPSESTMPTCKINGLLVYRDSGNNVELKITIMAGHTWGESEVIEEPTCSSVGKKGQVCKYCSSIGNPEPIRKSCTSIYKAF